MEHPTLRSWPIWLFVALVAVPPAALVLFADGPDDTLGAVTFAFYFAAAWFLLLWITVRPENLTGGMYAEIVVVALVAQIPLATGLEEALSPNTTHLASSIFGIGLPEELAKVLPVAALAVLHRRRWSALRPPDHLFLSAVSGLAFGAQEAVVYYTSSPSDALVLVWRSSPIPSLTPVGPASPGTSRVLRSSIAILRTGLRSPGSALAGVGLAVPAVLHGVNDWDPVTGSIVWVVLTVFSALPFLAYAKVGVPAATPRPGAPPVAHTRPLGPTVPQPSEQQRRPLVAGAAGRTVGGCGDKLACRWSPSRIRRHVLTS